MKFLLGGCIMKKQLKTFIMMTAIIAGAVSTSTVIPKSIGLTTTSVSAAPSSAPVIVTQPKSVTAAEKTSVTFSVYATGDNLTYQWQYRTSGSSVWKDCSSKSSSMTVYAYASGNSYRCVVSSGSVSVISNIAYLTVVAGPKIDANPRSCTTYENETASFSVKASGSNLKYQWQRSKDGVNWSNISGATKSTYNFMATTDYDDYRFRCVVTSGSKSVTSYHGYLHVIKFAVAQGPSDMTTADNRTIQLNARAAGLNVHYQWQYSTNGSYWINDSSASGKTSSLSYYVTNSSKVIYFRCMIDNGYKTIYTDTAKVTVNITPTFREQPDSVTVNAGEKVTFSTTVGKIADEPFSSQWYYSKDNGATWSPFQLGRVIRDTSGSTLKFILEFTADSSMDNYQFKCNVGTNYTSAWSSSAVLRVNIPFMITKQPETVSVGRGKYATFSVQASGRNLTYQWQYSTNGGLSWRNLSYENQSTYSIIASSSTEGYHFRCLVSSGNSTIASNPVRYYIPSAVIWTVTSSSGK